MSSTLEVFLLFLSFACYASALYFHIGETEKKCFIEDIPDETMVVGKAVRRVCYKHLEGVRDGAVTTIQLQYNIRLITLDRASVKNAVHNH